MKITVGDTGQNAFIQPIDNYSGVEIHAVVDEPFMWESRDVRYQVNWPSIGRVDIEAARQFAAGILAACDWLEAKKGGTA